MTGRNLSPHSQGSWAGQHEAAVTASRNSHGSSAACQEETLASPMAAGVTPSVNVGQQNADAKEYTRSSIYPGTAKLMAWTILNDLTSPELSSLEERGDVELLQPTNEVRETIKSPVSATKLQQNSETTKDLAKKNCLLSYHSALIAGASVKAA